MQSYWLSWWQTKQTGAFTLHTPWWRSGEREDGARSICAAVQANSEPDALEAVFKAHDKRPASLEMRFCEERSEGWTPFSDRFPRAKWMVWPEKQSA